jgi:ribosome biogenesis GTPase A
MARIQWYPGHIAKAERDLKEQLKKVDLVLEVRDARIPISSHHPLLLNWIGIKPRLLVLNRVDLIPETIKNNWITWFKEKEERFYFTNAKQGEGVKPIVRAANSLGEQINQKRQEKGLLPRPVRAVVLGFPNVGKSALINRLLGRKVAPSARRVGVTRQLKWVRISPTLELLDAPGVIPSRLEDQKAAVKLAICEDIGEASYDNQLIATDFIALLKQLERVDVLARRYNLEINADTAEDYLERLAKHRYQEDKEKCSVQILNDFRQGLLGPIALELPPS